MSNFSQRSIDPRAPKWTEQLREGWKARQEGYRKERKSEDLKAAKTIYEARSGFAGGNEASFAAGSVYVGTFGPQSSEERMQQCRQRAVSHVNGRWLAPEPLELDAGPTTIGTSLMFKIAKGMANPIERAQNLLLFEMADDIVMRAEAELERDPENGDAHLRLFFASSEIHDPTALKHLAAAAHIRPEVAERIKKMCGAEEAETKEAVSN